MILPPPLQVLIGFWLTRSNAIFGAIFYRSDLFDKSAMEAFSQELLSLSELLHV
jgi:hypothetical protein